MTEQALSVHSVQTFQFDPYNRYHLVHIHMHVNLNIQNDHLDDHELLANLTKILSNLAQKQKVVQQTPQQVNILVFPYSQEFTLRYWMALTNQYNMMECHGTRLRNIIVTVEQNTKKQTANSHDMTTSLITYASKYTVLNNKNACNSAVNFGVPIDMDAIIATLLEKEGLCVKSHDSGFSLRNSLIHSSVQAEKSEELQEILDQIYSKFDNLQEVMESL